MVDKIDQLTIGTTSYDIDLPPDASPSIASLTVSGTTDVSDGTLKLNILQAKTSSSSTTYGPGTSGQVLKSNGTNAYWGSDSSDNSSQTIGANYKAKNAYGGYSVLITNNENKLVPTVSGSGTSTATTKTMNTESFNPFGLYVYTSSSSNRAADALCSGSTFTAYSSFDLRYAFNCGSTLTANAPVYIVAQLQSDGQAKLASPYYTQTLPSTDDGKIYIYFAQAVSTTNVNLQEGHPIYYYKNNKIWEYTGDNIPTTYVSSVNGNSGAITGIATTSDLASKLDKINSTTDNAVVRFDGTTGDIQESGVTIADNGNLSIQSGNISLMKGKFYSSKGGSTSADAWGLQLNPGGMASVILQCASISGASNYIVNVPGKNGTLATTDDIPNIPTTTTAGQVLKSTSTAGTVEWGSAGGGGLEEISTQYIRITNLSTGVYKLTYNGAKYIYYKGTSSTSTHTVAGGSGAVVLVVNRYSTTGWTWYYLNSSSSASYQSIYYGYTSSSVGSYNSKSLNDLTTSTAAYQDALSIMPRYRHSIKITGSIYLEGGAGDLISSNAVLRFTVDSASDTPFYSLDDIAHHFSYGGESYDNYFEIQGSIYYPNTYSAVTIGFFIEYSDDRYYDHYLGLFWMGRRNESSSSALEPLGGEPIAGSMDYPISVSTFTDQVTEVYHS